MIYVICIGNNMTSRRIWNKYLGFMNRVTASDIWGVLEYHEALLYLLFCVCTTVSLCFDHNANVCPPLFFLLEVSY